MTISALCPCGHHLEADEANAGRRLQCPACGRDWTVPLDGSRTTPSGPQRPGPAPFVLLDAKGSGGSKRGPRGWNAAILWLILGALSCLFASAIYTERGSLEASRRYQCTNNLKTIGMALHAYHERHHAFPPAAITDPNGRPLLSWRVAILPYIDEEEKGLYEQFHLDEPWNSAHNFALLDRMPSTFACPSDPKRKRGMTNYQVIVGPNTTFTPDFEPLPSSAITDDPNQTILVAESRHGVPWSCPEDIPVGMALHERGLGSHHPGGFQVCLASGAVAFLKRTLNARIFHALMTRDGNETLGPGQF